MSNYAYKSGSLVISLPTRDPAALHEQLLIGLTGAMRNYVMNEDHDETHLSIIALLESLLPGEAELSRMIA